MTDKREQLIALCQMLNLSKTNMLEGKIIKAIADLEG